ncbi:hypothetical protein SFOMI_5216 [Sphingobium fuliginis]|uniref:Uncharacterized protein n=2 Tax=Sphingobium TaxID=165695 RepID=T0J8E7_9SPHN|nr:hypothetical protein M529_00210 [Sphingobium ummariense RL-3]GAY24631.1 hypothetical protein SFOMI_5216 [Sphingobium fuliginis]
MFLPSTFEVLQASEQRLQKGMIALAGQEHRQFALQERGELATRGRILVYVVKDKRAQHDALAGFSLAAFSGKPCLKSLSSLA